MRHCMGRCERARVIRPVRRAISLVLVLALLAPSLAAAQSPAPAAPPGTPAPGAPRPPGTFAPLTPSRAELGSVNRSLAGPDYRLGPGDLVDVQIVGRLESARHQLVVDPEGNLSIPPIGAVNVGGRTLLEANRRLAERAREVFRFAEASMAVLIPRSFEVTVTGEVERPGTLQALATQRLHEVLLTTGGITSRGSARHVQVMYDGAGTEVDVLRFELKGDLAQNPYVREGLRVHVPPRLATITLSGGVRRPGEYEMSAERSLRELLDLTGGVSVAGAASDARVTRVGPDGRKETFSVDLAPVVAAARDVAMQPGDVLYVPPLATLQDVVEVRGAFAGAADSSRTSTTGKSTIVQRFELARGERVKDIVVKAGGAAAHADLRLAFIDRTDAGPAQRIPVDLHRLLVEKDETQNILVHNADVLVLPVVEDKVYVVGEVKAPGAQDFRPDLTPREYIAAAGGPGNRAKMQNASVTFRNGRTYAMAEAPPIEAGATITVPEVAVKWWQDYVTIAQLVATLLTAYTGLYILFNGPISNNNN